MSWSRYGIIKLVYLVYFKILENELFVIYLYVVCIYIYFWVLYFEYNVIWEYVMGKKND